MEEERESKVRKRMVLGTKFPVRSWSRSRSGMEVSGCVKPSGGAGGKRGPVVGESGRERPKWALAFRR